jgi:hypothetical protein
MMLGAHGPTAPVEIIKLDSNWSNFTLKDGTLLRVRPEIQNVVHEPGRYNQAGEPIYHFQIGFVVTTVSPPQLMEGFVKLPKPRSKSKKRKKK